MQSETNYEDMFKAAVMDLAEVSVALGLPDQVTLTANGNAEILAAIRRKDARIAELEKALRWCSEEQAYWHAGLQFFTNGEDTIEAPEDVRKTFLSLMET